MKKVILFLLIPFALFAYNWQSFITGDAYLMSLSESDIANHSESFALNPAMRPSYATYYTASYVKWFSDINIFSGELSFKKLTYAYGIKVGYFKEGELQSWTENKEQGIVYKNSSLALKMDYSFFLKKTIYGLSCDYIHSQFVKKKISYYAFNGGMVYPLKKWKFGATVQNINFNGEPLNMNVGIAFHSKDTSSVSFGFFGLYHYQFEGVSDIRIGFDYLYNKTIDFRLGYRFYPSLIKEELNYGISLGGGLLLNKMRIDVAYVPAKIDNLFIVSLSKYFKPSVHKKKKKKEKNEEYINPRIRRRLP